MTAVRIAYQGEPGAFSEAAILARAPAAVAFPCPDFSAVARAVLSGRTEYGLLPVENSTAGSITEVYDLLAGGDLRILDEYRLRIPLCLAAPPGSGMDQIRHILSHPAALGQCTRFLAGHPGVTAQAVADTAGAARLVAESGDRTLAALASREAASRYGLETLAEEVQDRTDNVTRFYLVGPPDAAPQGDGRNARAVLLAETANRPGALAALLEPFAAAGINLTKLESRPARERWTYRFILELETGPDDQWRDAVDRARRVAASVRVLGSFGGSEPPSGRPVETARIVGLGLIGGSIARELAARGITIWGEDTDAATLRRARAEGVVRSPAPGSLAEVLVLAIPPEAAAAWLEAHAAELGGYGAVLDVAGTKRRILETAARLDLRNFVGTHPMAGDHRSGWDASRLGLFQNATVYLCPTAGGTGRSLALAEALWRSLGACCQRIEAEEHDTLVAHTSHLPQVLASALALTLQRSGIPRPALGPGGREATRLAQSSPTLWAEACLGNRQADIAALEKFQEVVRQLAGGLAAGDGVWLTRFFREGRDWASAPP